MAELVTVAMQVFADMPQHSGCGMEGEVTCHVPVSVLVGSTVLLVLAFGPIVHSASVRVRALSAAGAGGESCQVAPGILQRRRAPERAAGRGCARWLADLLLRQGRPGGAGRHGVGVRHALNLLSIFALSM
eukprot:11228362-Lingulodinium_polyedra.AAC.2